MTANSKCLHFLPKTFSILALSCTFQSTGFSSTLEIDNSIIHESRPSGSVVGEFSGTRTAAVEAGLNHTLYITGDGTLMALGKNDYGQLGVGDNVDKSEPTEVLTGGKKVKAVAAGHFHTLYVTFEGDLYAMGRNYFGQLGMSGFADTGNLNTPAQVDLGGDKVQAVAAGEHHSLFVKEDGSLWAMGLNNKGQLGVPEQVGTTNPVGTPQQVETAGPVTKVECGRWYSFYIQ
jgi:alpha-tubulin suppressor-like RCC1 family protein